MPFEVITARSVGDVVTAVRSARERGLRAKAIGSGHSFTPVAMTDGVLIDVSQLDGILAHDRAARRVVVGAGTTLQNLGAQLASLGLAFENLGDIDAQTLAGAISTGTHGTGIGFGGLATQVVGVTFVDGCGNVVTVNDKQQPELVPALAIAVGVLGILVAIELQCVPAFAMTALEHAESFDLIDDLAEYAREVDHIDAYWWPHTEILSVKENSRLPVAATYTPPTALANWVEDELLGTAAHWLACTVGVVSPAATPTLNRIAGSLYGNRSFTDRAQSVFTSPRRVRFREMEFGIPVAALPTALRAVRALIERKGWALSFPIEIRFAAADDRWLSSAYGRETAYIAVHRYWREDPREVFAGIEEVLWDFEARPHWGKVHSKGAAELAGRFELFDRFLDLRRTLDPDGVFENSHAAYLFGTRAR